MSLVFTLRRPPLSGGPSPRKRARKARQARPVVEVMRAWCAAMKATQPMAEVFEDLLEGAVRVACLGDGSLPHIAAALWLAFKLLCARNSE